MRARARVRFNAIVHLLMAAGNIGLLGNDYAGVGVEHFEVDATRFDEVVMRRTRRCPDTAAALKRAHEAAEYDRWFREQVAEGIAEADSPDAEWYTPEQVRASAMAEIRRASGPTRPR